jgi:threonine/homoserine/homoserine lactone efflux protein
MGDAIGGILALAVGVAISPLPIMAVILILFTPKARSNGPAFLAGWMLGLAVISAVVLVIFDPQDLSNEGPSKAASALHLALGVLLLGLAARRWRNRPPPGETPTPPKWMSRITTLEPPQAIGLGALLAGLNPKNLVLTISAAVSVAQAELGGGETAAVMVIYIVIASLTIGAPVALLVFAPKKAQPILDSWRTGLAEHAVIVGVTLFSVFGALLVGKGIAGLT